MATMRRSWWIPMLGLLALGACRSATPGASTGREVAIAVTEAGFEPASVTVPRGEAVTLVVTRRTDATCATSAVVPRLGKTFELPLNKPVRIAIPTSESGRIGFACPMDMYKGQVIVE